MRSENERTSERMSSGDFRTDARERWSIDEDGMQAQGGSRVVREWRRHDDAGDRTWAARHLHLRGHDRADAHAEPAYVAY